MTVYLSVCQQDYAYTTGQIFMKKESEKMGHVVTWIPLYFQTDPDYCLDTKKNHPKDLDFPFTSY